MDIHKPKPWHSVREFLKEYLIIVVGVLTALGAEAVVQTVHEARLSAEARDAVRDEMNVDITNIARRYADDRAEGCILRRLDEIEALLDRAEAGEAFPPPGAVGIPLRPIIFTERWATATAGGRTSLLSSDEQRQFGRVYAYLSRLDQDLYRERDAWFVLRALKGRRRLSPEMLNDQRLALSRARDLDTAIHLNFDQAQFYGRQLGAKGDARLATHRGHAPVQAYHAADICQPLSGAPAAKGG